jgi:hypothetical protein
MCSFTVRRAPTTGKAPLDHYPLIVGDPAQLFEQIAVGFGHGYSPPMQQPTWSIRCHP